jgi:hypothetical protein
MPETANSTKATAGGAKAAELSAAIREEVISSVKQAQQFTLDVVSTWVDVVGKVVPELPTAPYAPQRSEVVANLTTMFDAAEELLSAQRKFAADLVNVLVPAS